MDRLSSIELVILKMCKECYSYFAERRNMPTTVILDRIMKFDDTYAALIEYSIFKSKLADICRELMECKLIDRYEILNQYKAEEVCVQLWKHDKPLVGIKFNEHSLAYCRCVIHLEFETANNYSGADLIVSKIKTILNCPEGICMQELYDIYCLGEILNVSRDDVYKVMQSCVNSEELMCNYTRFNDDVLSQSAYNYNSLGQRILSVTYSEVMAYFYSIINHTRFNYGCQPMYWPWSRTHLEKGILDDKDYVLCGASALYYGGLILYINNFPTVFTSYKEVEGYYTIGEFIYNNNIDYTHYVSRSLNNPTILVPTKERAIVESIIFIDQCDEGLLIEALKSYLYSFKDIDKLCEVADFFKLSRRKLDYWIKEAEEDEDE